MPDDTINKAERLTALRAKIDAVDESMHTLLMQRASVIDELIAIKGADTTKGAAFRPGREAAMMETLSARHTGSIPFAMIGHIWREIISTFTWLQAGYEVHVADTVAPAGALRDLARFQFGFTVPMHVHTSVEAAFAKTQASGNAIALVARGAEGNWWEALGAENKLMIMTRLPIFEPGFETVDAFAIAPQLSDPTPFDVRLYTGRVQSAESISEWADGEIICQQADDEGGASVLLAITAGGKTPQELLDIRAVGGYFAPTISMPDDN